MDRLYINHLNMTIFDIDGYSQEDFENANRRCEEIVDSLNCKVNNFDDSLEALYDFIEFVDKITDNPEAYRMFYGDRGSKCAILGLSCVMCNRKLFTIYYLSRGLGTQLIRSESCLRRLCIELRQKNIFQNIQWLLNTSLIVYCIKEDNYYFGRLSFDEPELKQYIAEIKTRAINEDYEGESSIAWHDESNAWFGDNPNPLRNNQLYFI